jgi:hypothetical protein
METHMFDQPVTVLTADGQHSETFGRGERVKNIKRIRHRVMFEPVDPHRIARIYAMDWSDFEKTTRAVREARA